MVEEKYILDTREKNREFLQMQETQGWERKRLTVSHFIYLEEGCRDRDMCDFTNENGDGAVEFKAFADWINSCTEDGGERMES